MHATHLRANKSGNGKSTIFLCGIYNADNNYCVGETDRLLGQTSILFYFCGIFCVYSTASQQSLHFIGLLSTHAMRIKDTVCHDH